MFPYLKKVLYKNKECQIKFSKKFENKIYKNNHFLLKSITNQRHSFLNSFHFYTIQTLRNTKKYYYFIYTDLLLKKF